jgi:hypothetical protein
LPAARLAEGVGFEPTETFASPVFKTGAINRSTTPPRKAKLGKVGRIGKLRALGPCLQMAVDPKTIAMKQLPTAIAILSLLVIPALAGEPFPIGRLPAEVTAAVEDYLPGGEIVSARADEDDDRAFFDVNVDYKDMLLKLEVTRKGRIREIDLNRRFVGAASLFSRGLPVSMREVPAMVTTTLNDCFPGGEIISAALQQNGDKQFYEMNVQYKDLLLKTAVSSDGEMLDIDTRKR